MKIEPFKVTVNDKEAEELIDLCNSSGLSFYRCGKWFFGGYDFYSPHHDYRTPTVEQALAELRAHFRPKGINIKPFKVRVDPESSRKIQEACFAVGIYHPLSGATVQFLDSPVIKVSSELLTYSGVAEEHVLSDSSVRELTVEQALAELREEKERNAYHPEFWKKFCEMYPIKEEGTAAQKVSQMQQEGITRAMEADRRIIGTAVSDSTNNTVWVCTGNQFEQEESAMRKQVSDVYENTQDALVVERYINPGCSSIAESGSIIDDPFIQTLIVKQFKAEILAEAQRREAESKKEK